MVPFDKLKGLGELDTNRLAPFDKLKGRWENSTLVDRLLSTSSRG
ncbi:hypothetical protein [Gordonia iterans]